MEDLVRQLIENSKKQPKEIKSKQRFYREFDLALRLASRKEEKASFQTQLDRIEILGRDAGISMGEIAYRKKTLLWAASQSLSS